MSQPAIDQVIVVNEHDCPLGAMDKLEAHQQGVLHRAFSVFLFRSTGEMILQRRAITKYHSGGLWTNTCCSHQAPDEETLDAAARRLKDELGIEGAVLETHGTLYYMADVGNGLIEHEYDHLLTGTWDGPLHPNPAEADATMALQPNEVELWLEREPEAFTMWFGKAWRQINPAAEEPV